VKEFDAIVIGAGVVEAAVANALLDKKMAKRVAVLEKEPEPAAHTSGRNSGVIHSGFNLKPGSLKAKFCVEGNARMRAFCEKKNIPMRTVGTVVVAQDEREVGILGEILKRGQANGTPDVKIVDAQGLKRLEPNAAGLAALHSPSGSITSGRKITNALVADAVSKGCEFFFVHRSSRIDESDRGFEIKAGSDVFRSKWLVNCGGLYADEIAHQLGVGLAYTIIPFRGEYYKLAAEKAGIVNSMIYPVPDLAYPFLGVHWTKTIDGDLIIGPNATIAMGRESYYPADIHWVDTFKMLVKPNFWNQFRSPNFRTMAWGQLKISLSRKNFINEARKLVPDVDPADFKKGKSGNRAQLVDKAGKLVDDMIVERKGRSLHVLNAVSPGFTCSLPFADYLVDQLTLN
jgi:L-2-hydroxyglutarate oxidase